MNSFRHSFHDTKMKILTTEFYSKVTHDFKRYIFLGLKKETMAIEEVKRKIWSLDGYEGHKAVSHKGEVAHFYIRFKNAACAEKAIVFFRTSHWLFNAETVNNILLSWYMFEMTQERPPSWTTAYVELVDGMDQNALAPKKINFALRPFGYIRIPYKEGPQTRVEVIFMTFAEALASTIALGSWQNGKDDQSSDGYKVKIVSSSKEEWLFSVCGSSPYEAFELDYFVTPHQLNASAPEYIYPAPKRECNKRHNNKRRRATPRSGNVGLDIKSSHDPVKSNKQTEIEHVDTEISTASNLTSKE